MHGVDFPKDFGPDILQEPGKELNDMKSEEYEFYLNELEEQKRQIWNEYQRIILVAVVSLGDKFNNPNSSRVKTLHVKGGYLLPLIEEGHPFSMSTSPEGTTRFADAVMLLIAKWAVKTRISNNLSSRVSKVHWKVDN